jgi:hypothetical protein
MTSISLPQKSAFELAQERLVRLSPTATGRIFPCLASGLVGLEGTCCLSSLRRSADT